MSASSNSYTIDAATINAPSGSKAQSTPTFSFDAANRKVTASVAATSGTAYANVTGAGYTGTGTKSGTFTMSASSNSYTIAAGALGKTAASATVASDGLVTNISNGAVNASDKIATTTGANGVYRITASGSGGANVATAGYLASGTSNSNSTTNAYYIAKGTTTAQANSVTVSGRTVTYNINAVVTAGYQQAGTY